MSASRWRWRLGAAIWLTIAAGACWAGPANDLCLMCHSAPGVSKARRTGQTTSRRIDIAKYAASAHGGRACVDCHEDLARATLPHGKKTAPVECTRCHRKGNGPGAPSEQAVQYADSIHGRAVARHDPDAPRCFDCHGSHYIRPAADPPSSVYRLNIPRTCGLCHSDPGIVKRHNIPQGQVLKFYQASVHGRALNQQGLAVAAVCTDCHGVHTIQAGADAMSAVNRANLPATCGRCHRNTYDDYRESIHGQALARGDRDVPVCTDCHGEHSIRSPRSPSSSVYPTQVAQTCSRCHASERIERKYGLPRERYATYRESFHGIASRFGSLTAANCASCHGAHDIRPSSDPKSSIHKANLPHTCGQCHKGANENFARGKIHVIISPEGERTIYYVSTAFKWLTISIMLALVGHIFLDLVGRWRQRRRGP